MLGSIAVVLVTSVGGTSEQAERSLQIAGDLTLKGPHPWADIRAFGATPDDDSDDTAAIQAAIDNAAGGGVVYVPKGVYRTTGVVVRTGHNYVRIVGAGRGSRLELTRSGSLIQFAASDGGVEHVTLDCHNVPGSSGLRVAPEHETETRKVKGVNQNFNAFHDLLVSGCTEAGIALRAGPGGGCWYNTFHTIHVIGSAWGVVFKAASASDVSGPNRNAFFSVRIGQSEGGGGVRIEAGNTNTFFATGLEGLGQSGIFVAAEGEHREPTDGNRFYGTTFEAVGSPTIAAIDNRNPDTQFVGNVDPNVFDTFAYYGNVGIGTGVERPKAKLHVEVGGGFTVNAPSALLPQSGGIMLSGRYQGEPGLHGNGSIRPNAFQQVPSGPYGGGVSLQRYHYVGKNPSYPYEFEDVLNVTASANVGVGTTNPGYKLHVNGDAGATAWNVASSRAFKEDIRVLDDAHYRDMLQSVRALDLVSYRYKAQYTVDRRPRVGLLAEDLPDDLLSADRKAVDLHELTVYAIAAVKAQQQQIEQQQRALEACSRELAALKTTIDNLMTASSRAPRDSSSSHH